MTGYGGGHRQGWTDTYPTERLLAGSKARAPLLVDIGGNKGQHLELFRNLHPEQAGQLVLEDLPEVVASAECAPEIQRIAYDFFTDQPVKGARAYYMSSILHDWSDGFAAKILQNVKAAMTPGYSILLINDHILPSEKAPPQMTVVDMIMMVKVAAGERTEGMFRELLEASGLKIVKIWTNPAAVSSVIEAELE